MAINKNSLAMLATLFIFLIFGLYFDQLGFKFIAVVSLAGALALISFLPNKLSIFVLLSFISVQGFFKVVSNYHPAVHIGADLVVIGLFAKFIIQKSLSSAEMEKELPPLSYLFMIHFAWVFICYFNPYSLGIIPSLAGSKVYISMLILFFFGYYLTESVKDIHRYFYFFIAFAVVHSIFAIYQGLVGPASVLSLHPRYGVQLQKYQGKAFRPFGLTHVPGGPSVYIYTSLPFVFYFLYSTKNLFVRIACLAFLPLSGLSLLLCQVRSAILKAIVGIAMFVFTFLTSRYPFRPAKRTMALVGTFALTGLIVSFFPLLMTYSVGSYSDNTRAFERSLTSFDVDTISEARKNTYGRFGNYLKHIPFGAGFSRVGASAGAFKQYQKEDNLFPQDYFFSDNLFITALIEIGAPGLFFLTLLIVLVLGKGFYAWRTEQRASLIGPQLAILAALFAIFIGSYGGEGIIYNPESAFFWFFAGVLIKTLDPNFKTELT